LARRKEVQEKAKRKPPIKGGPKTAPEKQKGKEMKRRVVGQGNLQQNIEKGECPEKRSAPRPKGQGQGNNAAKPLQEGKRGNVKP